MKFNKKIIASAIGAASLTFIIEKLLSPALEFFYSVFLKFGTMFISSFSDSVYRSIANGFSEQASLLSLYYLLFVMFFCILFPFAALMGIKRGIQDELNETPPSTDKTSVKTQRGKVKHFFSLPKYILSVLFALSYLSMQENCI